MNVEKAKFAMRCITAPNARNFRTHDLSLPAHSFLQASAATTFRTIQNDLRLDMKLILSSCQIKGEYFIGSSENNSVC